MADRRDNTHLMRVPIAVHLANKVVAERERRQMNAQLEITFEAGMRALGYGHILDAVRSAMDGGYGAEDAEAQAALAEQEGTSAA